MAYTVSEIHPQIFLVEADTQFEITSMFIRIQEFYESPYPNIYRSIFTLDQFMDTYVTERQSEKFTYFEDWAGFNIPGEIFREFFNLYIGNTHLSKKELFLYQNLLHQIYKNKPFYVIGTYNYSEKELVIKHELAHAFWYLFHEYKQKMEKYINEIDPKIINRLTRKLYRLGYARNQIKDEIHAYLCTENEQAINWNPDIPVPKEIVKTFQHFLENKNPTKGI